MGLCAGAFFFAQPIKWASGMHFVIGGAIGRVIGGIIATHLKIRACIAPLIIFN
jgi:hypothetical protein